jgi:hypothetical protein
VIVGHVMGVPVEEGVLQLVPLGATVITAVAMTGRATLDSLRRHCSARIASRRKSFDQQDP